MKKQYSGIRELTKEEIKEIYTNGLIILDTSVLLGLYRFKQQSRDEWLMILKDIKDRVFLPYQIGLEFHRNHKNEYRSYKKEIKLFQDKLNDFKSDSVICNASERFKESCFSKMEEKFAEISKFLEGELAKIDSEDIIYNSLEEIFQDNIGEKPDVDWYEEKNKKGKLRYEKKIPPGYEDLEKHAPKWRKYLHDQEFGDLYSWFQMLQIAQKANKSILFITRDEKEDWWEISKGEKIGSHPLLREEFFAVTGKFYHQVTPTHFLENFKELISKSKVSEETLEETKQLETKEPTIDGKETLKKILSELKDREINSYSDYMLISNKIATDDFMKSLNKGSIADDVNYWEALKQLTEAQKEKSVRINSQSLKDLIKKKRS